MVRVREEDYYVDEPCIVRISPHKNPIPAVPSRWIKRAGVLRGVMRQLEVINNSYRVSGSFEIPVDDLVTPYPLFVAHHARYNLPPLRNFLRKQKCYIDMKISLNATLARGWDLA